jgi:hypothetical protein
MGKMEREFWVFHQENPYVYEMFNRFTQSAIRRGFQHLSSDMVCHRIRWETTIETSDREFKLNNNHTAYYGRLWMLDHPEHKGFFRTRGIG